MKPFDSLTILKYKIVTMVAHSEVLKDVHKEIMKRKAWPCLYNAFFGPARGPQVPLVQRYAFSTSQSAIKNTPYNLQTIVDLCPLRYLVGPTILFWPNYARWSRNSLSLVCQPHIPSARGAPPLFFSNIFFFAAASPSLFTSFWGRAPM